MNKKQMTAFVNQIITSIIATNGDGELMTEEEARTFLGMMLKRQAKKLVADTLRVDVADVVWADVAAKAQVEAEEDSADAIA